MPEKLPPGPAPVPGTGVLLAPGRERGLADGLDFGTVDFEFAAPGASRGPGAGLSSGLFADLGRDVDDAEVPVPFTSGPSRVDG